MRCAWFWIGFACIALAAGCSPANEDLAASLRVGLPKGTPIELMLLTPAESGGTGEGETLAFVVAKSVEGDTGIAIPAGTAVSANVVHSRSAGALSAVLNEPARLVIEFEPIQMMGVSIPIAPSAESRTPEYAFTRENTGLPRGDAVEKSLEDAHSREILRQLAEALESGREAGGQDPLEDASVQALLKELRMESAQQMMEAGESGRKGLDRVLGLADDLRHGRLGMADAELSLGLAALEELGSLAGQVTGTLKGIFKGRNIRAHIGTRVNVVTTDSVTVYFD